MPRFLVLVLGLLEAFVATPQQAAATEGCVSIAEADMVAMLRELRAGDTITIV